MATAGSIFAKIVAGEIPSHRYYENEHVIAFLDINPLAEGHTLIVTRRAVERLEDLRPEEAAAVGQALVEVTRKLLAVVGVAGCNILQNNGKIAGQDVPHVHFHVIPRREGDNLGYRWRAHAAAPEQLESLMQRLKAAP